MQDMKQDNIKLAAKVFESIDIDGQQKLTNKNLSNYFKDYPDSSVRVIMTAVDFNQDGVITRN